MYTWIFKVFIKVEVPFCLKLLYILKLPQPEVPITRLIPRRVLFLGILLWFPDFVRSGLATSRELPSQQSKKWNSDMPTYHLESPEHEEKSSSSVETIALFSDRKREKKIYLQKVNRPYSKQDSSRSVMNPVRLILWTFKNSKDARLKEASTNEKWHNMWKPSAFTKCPEVIIYRRFLSFNESRLFGKHLHRILFSIIL